MFMIRAVGKSRSADHFIDKLGFGLGVFGLFVYFTLGSLNWVFFSFLSICLESY